LAAAGGQVDILVSNAGIFPLAAIADTSPSTFEQTLTANLTAPYRLLHALLPGMRAQRSGHVVTIGSVADRRIFGGNGAYSASKFGIRGFTEALRELTTLVDELESDALDVDALTERVERAAELVQWCRERIDGARLSVEEVLVRLEDTSDQPDAD
jgi:exodeoxyribonuclease VII small subunit